MKNQQPTSIAQFYQEFSQLTGKPTHTLLPADLDKEIGHFNVFDIAETVDNAKRKGTMPYNRRAYYKISLIKGQCTAAYADKVIEIDGCAILFATPKVPYHWIPKNNSIAGNFCVFTADFLNKNNTGFALDELPIFKPGTVPIFNLNHTEAGNFERIFEKIKTEIASDYLYKYDLLRNYTQELIHAGQKLQPAPTIKHTANASARISSLFIELLERQFPIDTPSHRFSLRTATEYAERLSVHVNHLNKVLKENLGKTTTEIIAARVAQEAKILLKQTNWTVSEIAFALGFDEIAHFSNFFKKHTAMAPLSFRS